MLYGDNRNTYRRIFFDVWRKYTKQRPLEGIESTMLPILMMHPEYHNILAQPERYLDKDYTPENGEANPFLHMGLHISIAEQLSLDQPAGIRDLHTQACQHFGDRHAAEHALIDCLAESLWQMQRQHSDFDGRLYLNCIRAQLGLPILHAEDTS